MDMGSMTCAELFSKELRSLPQHFHGWDSAAVVDPDPKPIIGPHDGRPLNLNSKPDQCCSMCLQLRPPGISLHCWWFGPCCLLGSHPNLSHGTCPEGAHLLCLRKEGIWGQDLESAFLPLSSTDFSGNSLLLNIISLLFIHIIKYSLKL